MIRRLFLLFGFLAAVPFAETAWAASTGFDAHTEVEIVSSTKTLAPGSEILLAIRFKTEPEWHVYWKNPGDSGMTPDIRWELPADLKAGDIRWPYPHLISQPPLASYGYEAETFLAAPVTVSSAAVVGDNVTLKADVRWLACKVECIPGKAVLDLTLPVAAAAVLDERWTRAFSETRAQWPIASEDWSVQAAIDGEKLVLIISPKIQSNTMLSTVHFFPENPQLIHHPDAQEFKNEGNGYRLTVNLARNRPKNLTRLDGVLVSDSGWRGPDSEKALEVSVPLGQNAPAAAAKAPIGFGLALGLAFIGGLILNLMPCVLPVLSLKILSFVKEASENPRALLMHGLVYAAGVLVSFWILAALLLGLQAAGHRIGWGFQLQSPIFLVVLAAIFFFFALNLLGLFEVGVGLTGVGQGAVRHGYRGSFFSGFFATVVATPCTAPFMGAALGFTLTQPPPVTFAVFTALAAGMAAPYVILCAHPAFLKIVPKPGPWMVTLKKLLAIPLFLTVAWLLWVLALQVKPEWFTAKQEAGQGIPWENFSEARVNELRAQNRPVFIDFTAAWCLTCKVNERVALDRPEIAAEFAKRGIVPLKADWTSQDETIAAALARYGRNSIPLYVYYAAGKSEPKILPEVLTPAIVLKALDE